MSTEIEETVKRLSAMKGVKGLFVINQDGIPIRYTFEPEHVTHYAALVHQLVNQARAIVRELDSTDDLVTLRVRSKNHELIIAPEKEYCMCVIHMPDVTHD
jgi:dynein light chain roadblock-type